MLLAGSKNSYTTKSIKIKVEWEHKAIIIGKSSILIIMCNTLSFTSLSTLS